MFANFNETIEGWANKLDRVLSSSPPRHPPLPPPRTPPPRTPPPSPAPSSSIVVKASANYVPAISDSPPRSSAPPSPSRASPSPRATPSPRASPAQQADALASPDELRFTQYLKSHKITELKPGCPRTRKIALRGLPDNMRAQFWKQITGANGLERKNSGVYASLLLHPAPAEQLIQTDVSRTLSSHQFFERNGGGQKALFNVLRAYSVFDLELQYTQGTSFVVALLLLHMSEEEAFWVLVQIIKTYQLREMYTHSLPLLRKMLYIFDRLLQTHFPKLFNHFKSHSVTPHLFASQWFTSLFSVPFAVATTTRVWDLMLCDGQTYMYRAALAMLEICQDELLSLPFDDMMRLLKTKAKSISPAALVQQAEKISISALDLRALEAEFARNVVVEF